MMTAEQAKAALDALEAGDAEATATILRDMIVAAAADDGDAGGDAPAELTDDAADGDAEALADDPAPDPEEEDPEMNTALLSLLKTTGHKNVESFSKEHLSMAERLNRLDSEASVVELSARRALVADLVKLGVEIPATAWEGDPSKQTPAKHLAGEPIAELRSRVEKYRAARPAQPVPPRSTGNPEEVTVASLTPYDLELCRKHSIKPEDHARNKNAVQFRRLTSASS